MRSRWFPDAVALASGATAGILAGIYYADYAPEWRSNTLDRLVERVADLLQEHVIPRESFGKDLRQSIEGLPLSLGRPSFNYRLLSVEAIAPLPDPRRESSLFDFTIMSEWCDHVPAWRSDNVYTWNSDLLVSQQFSNFLDWVTQSAPDYPASEARLSTRPDPNSGRNRRGSHGPSRSPDYRLDRGLALARLNMLDYSNIHLLQDAGGSVHKVMSCTTSPNLKSLMLAGDDGSRVLVAKGQAQVRVNSSREADVANDLSSTAQVEMRGSRVALVSLNRTPWFNSGLLKAYSRGPWRKNLSVDLYGKTGDFALIPDKLVVLLDPSVKLTFPKGRLEQNLLTRGSDSITISFGPHMLRTDDFASKEVDGSGSRFSVELASTQAAVIAVVARVLP